MSDINLKFINMSNDSNNSQVVLFQKNVATDFDELSVAWKVIKDCGQGWSHEFTYPVLSQVSASDAFGNRILRPLDAHPGQLFHVSKGLSGTELNFSGSSDSPQSIDIRNDLATGAITAEIYKDGKLLIAMSKVSPGQKASFITRPHLWIGVASQITEGSALDSAIMSNINTQISLEGLVSADIVMTGGGTGKDATPFSFSLENIQYA